MKFFLFTLSYLTIVYGNSLFSGLGSDVCLTQDCVTAAATVIEFIDESVDPCEDFYHFACGGWIKEHPIPEDKAESSVTSTSSDKLQIELKTLMEKPLKNTEPDFIKMAKTMYDSCLDTRAIEKAGSEPLKKVLRSLGGWPVVEGPEWDESAFNWMDTVFQIRQLGYGPNMLMSFGVTVNVRNNEDYVLQLHQATLGVSDRSYLLHGLEDKVTAAYFELILKSANKLGADETTSREELLKALEFETALANFSLPREELQNFEKLYNERTVKDLQELVPSIDWLKYFNGLLNDAITENEKIILTVPDYFVKVADLISRTDKRVLANYMLGRVVESSVYAMSKEWRELAQEYESSLTGQTVEPPRWTFCMAIVNIYFGIAVSNYYVSNYFEDETKNRATDILEYIHREFLGIIERLDWMDRKTKNKALIKAEGMQIMVGYPPELLNNTLVAKEYENIVLSDSYFFNTLQIQKKVQDKSASQLRKPVVKNDWKVKAGVATVNAYYSVLDNAIIIPAGILKDSFFDKRRPNFMNFGAIGGVIGHEITHGFDNTGRKFNNEGQLANWWDDETSRLYEEKVKCMINQYSNYGFGELKINGVNTQGENIADNGGIKEAYMAYDSWLEDNGEEPKLPGLDYTPKQLLWISYASTWCQNVRPEALAYQIISGSHTPAQFRVVGSVSNSHEFAKDYGCARNTPMNPETKCEVW